MWKISLLTIFSGHMEKKETIVFSWKDSRKLSLFCPSLTPLLAGADGVESQGHGHTGSGPSISL